MKTLEHFANNIFGRSRAFLRKHSGFILYATSPSLLMMLENYLCCLIDVVVTFEAPSVFFIVAPID